VKAKRGDQIAKKLEKRIVSNKKGAKDKLKSNSHPRNERIEK